jgi:hypothetical protein
MGALLGLSLLLCAGGSRAATEAVAGKQPIEVDSGSYPIVTLEYV